MFKIVVVVCALAAVEGFELNPYYGGSHVVPYHGLNYGGYGYSGYGHSFYNYPLNYARTGLTHYTPTVYPYHALHAASRAFPVAPVPAAVPVAPVVKSLPALAPVAPVPAIAPVAPLNPVPVVKSEIVPEYKTYAEAYSGPAQYDYGYSVSDPLSGDHKTQMESRFGDLVQGSYSLLEADGTKRTVKYSADALHGFNAVVHKEPALL